MTYHLRGTVLPDGVVRDLWLLGDRLTFDRPAGPADTVADGGFLLPGLVDVHTHPGSGAGADAGDPRFDPETFGEQIAAHRDAGATLLRLPGLLGPVPPALRTAPDAPRMITAGRWLAWAGLSKNAAFHTVADDLVAAAVREAKANDGWCKLMGDWDYEAPPVPYELLRDVTEAVHAAGGRVAAHCQSADGALNAARAGIDSIEHGMGMPEECVPLMAEHGTAYVPTLTAFARSEPGMRQRGTARAALWLAGHRTMIRRTREVHDAGGTVLAGTDSAPFGNVASEVEHLIAAGLPPETAVGAASWTAREFLGMPGLAEGGLADVTVYDADPGANPAYSATPGASSCVAVSSADAMDAVTQRSEAVCSAASDTTGGAVTATLPGRRPARRQPRQSGWPWRAAMSRSRQELRPTGRGPVGLPHPARCSSHVVSAASTTTVAPRPSPAGEPATRATPSTRLPVTPIAVPVHPATVWPRSWSPCALMSAPWEGVIDQRSVATVRPQRYLTN